MGTKTISITDDAYERLKAEKGENESFSDVVMRLTSGVKLSDFYGVLSEETGRKLEENIKEARGKHRDRREERMEEITDR
ncbi:MAG: antitoxin VapB family protein [Halobacteria archaeon]|nr:antitoxin VapB family protein [Halobacteria archaeon]